MNALANFQINSRLSNFSRSCNDDYVPSQSDYAFTSSTRDENADEPWSPTMRMKHTGRPQPPFTSELFTRSTCEPNELEKIKTWLLGVPSNLYFNMILFFKNFRSF